MKKLILLFVIAVIMGLAISYTPPIDRLPPISGQAWGGMILGGSVPAGGVPACDPFGTTTAHSSHGNGGGYQIGTFFAAPVADCTVNTMYLRANGSSGAVVRLAIYSAQLDDVTLKPLTQLAYTGEIAMESADTWVSGALNTTLTLESAAAEGGYFLLNFMGDAGVTKQYNYNSDGEFVGRYLSATYPTWNTTWNTNDGANSSQDIAIYATTE